MPVVPCCRFKPVSGSLWIFCPVGWGWMKKKKPACCWAKYSVSIRIFINSDPKHQLPNPHWLPNTCRALKYWWWWPQLRLLCSLLQSVRSAPPFCCFWKSLLWPGSSFCSVFENLEECRETMRLSRLIMPNGTIHSLCSINNCCVELLCLSPAVAVELLLICTIPFNSKAPHSQQYYSIFFKQNITTFLKDHIFQVCCIELH